MSRSNNKRLLGHPWTVPVRLYLICVSELRKVKQMKLLFSTVPTADLLRQLYFGHCALLLRAYKYPVAPNSKLPVLVNTGAAITLPYGFRG